MGGGSTQGRRPAGHLAAHTVGRVGIQSKTVQTGGWGSGRTGTEGTPVGAGEVQGNDLTRAAWGSQLDPLDLAWRTERHNFKRNVKEIQQVSLEFFDQSKRRIYILIYVYVYMVTCSKHFVEEPREREVKNTHTHTHTPPTTHPSQRSHSSRI